MCFNTSSRGICINTICRLGSNNNMLSNVFRSWMKSEDELGSCLRLVGARLQMVVLQNLMKFLSVKMADDMLLRKVFHYLHEMSLGWYFLWNFNYELAELRRIISYCSKLNFVIFAPKNWFTFIFRQLWQVSPFSTSSPFLVISIIIFVAIMCHKLL